MFSYLRAKIGMWLLRPFLEDKEGLWHAFPGSLVYSVFNKNGMLAFEFNVSKEAEMTLGNMYVGMELTRSVLGQESILTGSAAGYEMGQASKPSAKVEGNVVEFPAKEPNPILGWDL